MIETNIKFPSCKYFTEDNKYIKKLTYDYHIKIIQMRINLVLGFFILDTEQMVVYNQHFNIFTYIYITTLNINSLKNTIFKSSF